MFFSIIIPTYNAEKTLEDCLKSIFNSKYPYFEVIVVNDKSKDRSLEIAKKFNCKIIENNNKLNGVACCRNLGAKEAKGDFLFFVDSDIIQVRDNISKASRILENQSDIGILCGRLSKKSIQKNFWYQYITLHFHFLNDRFAKNELVKTIHWLTSECAIIKKEIFQSINGFDEKFSGVGCEEHDFGARVGKKHKIYAHKEIVFKHYRKGFFSFFITKCFVRAFKYTYHMSMFSKTRFENHGNASKKTVIDSSISFLILISFVISIILLKEIKLLEISILATFVLIFLLRKGFFLKFILENQSITAFLLSPIIEMIIGCFIFTGALSGFIKRQIDFCKNQLFYILH